MPEATEKAPGLEKEERKEAGKQAWLINGLPRS
jgi:hypothetical protein